jgi:hypothetical protein
MYGSYYVKKDWEKLGYHPDVCMLLNHLPDEPGTNQILVTYDSKVCKVKREDYLPDKNEALSFHAETDWRNIGYSVNEMLELLLKYGKDVQNIQFECWNHVLRDLVNIWEVDNIGDDYEYYCMITVGTGDEPYQRYGVCNQDYWRNDTNYVNRRVYERRYI